MYHCSIKIGNRSKGISAVRSSAYRAGEKLVDEETGLVEDFSRKMGVDHSEIFLPENAPQKYRDRETLWNDVQKVEKAKNAQLYREVEVSFPKGIDKEKWQEVIEKYVMENFVSKGMCADVAIHNPPLRNAKHQTVDRDGNVTHNPDEYVYDHNPHAHVMLTTRPFKENGEWGVKERKAYKLDENGEKIPVIDKKTGEQKIGARGRREWVRETVETTDWNNKENAEKWRASWAEICNSYLPEEQQIDHRSYERQGIDRVATIHEGQTARKREASGELSQIMEYNRQAREINAKLEEQEKQIKEKGEVLDELRTGQTVGRSEQREAEPDRRTAEPDREAETGFRSEKRTAERIRKRTEGLERTRNEVLSAGNGVETSTETAELGTGQQTDHRRSEGASRILEVRSRQRESTSREFSDGTFEIESQTARIGTEQHDNIAEQQRIGTKQYSVDVQADTVGRGTQYDLEKSEGIREQQHNINRKAGFIREKFSSIRERIIQIRDTIWQKFSRAEQTEQPDSSTRSAGKNTQSVKEQNTMTGMSRFAQIQADQQAAKEKEQEKIAPFQLEETLYKGQNVEVRYNDGTSLVLNASSSAEEIQRARMDASTRQATLHYTNKEPQNDQKETFKDKLNRFTQESKEGRTEPLQSEKQEQTEHIHHRRGHHR